MTLCWGHKMPEKFCGVSPDGDKITIALPGEAGAQQSITLTFREASALAMTLPRLLKMAMHLKFADATLRNVYHVGDYSVECASDNKHLLLTLSSGNGFDIVFGLDTEMVPALARDLEDGRTLLTAPRATLPH